MQSSFAQNTPQYYFVPQSLHQSTSQYHFVPQSLHKKFPSTTLHCKGCTKYSSVVLCTIKFAQGTSQCDFVLQSLYKAFPDTTLNYKAGTRDFPVNTFLINFVLKKLHEELHSTTLYYKKLAQSTSQYYFVLQSLHRALPGTTLYCKVCTRNSPILLCTPKFAQRTAYYLTALHTSYFAPGSPHPTLHNSHLTSNFKPSHSAHCTLHT